MDELDDDKDDGENSSGSSGDDNDMVPHDSSDEDNSSAERLQHFQRGIAETIVEAERFRNELNARTQQGAEDPPHDTSLKANMPSSTRGVDSGSDSGSSWHVKHSVDCETREACGNSDYAICQV